MQPQRTTLDRRYSSPGSTPDPWEDAQGQLRTAPAYWITTVRTDGRPHVTPAVGVVVDGQVHFCTGAEEQKARNLVGNPNCLVLTGDASAWSGRDVAVEGTAQRVTDPEVLAAVAAAYFDKYGEQWRFTPVEGGLMHGDGTEDAPSAWVFAVRAAKALGFTKGETYGQTTWRF